MFDPEDKDTNDFFDGPEIQEPEKKEKEPALTPDDPLYWEQESEWDHLQLVHAPGQRQRRYLILWSVGGVLALVAILALYFRYFSPYIEEATQYGYVENIEHRGTLFKTYEGVLLPYKELHDTTRVYDEDFVFTAKNEHVASDLARLQKGCLPARVEYRRYHGTLPWRGEAKNIIVKVDTADPRKILPPERRMK